VGVTFAANELPTRDLREKVATSIGEILSGRPEDEVLTVWIYASACQLYYRVVLEWPGLRREQMFYEGAEALPEAVAHWVGLYFPRLE